MNQSRSVPGTAEENNQEMSRKTIIVFVTQRGEKDFFKKGGESQERKDL